jgi:hypothetical protein
MAVSLSRLADGQFAPRLGPVNGTEFDPAVDVSVRLPFMKEHGEPTNRWSLAEV